MPDANRTNQLSDATILTSWHKNAAPWTEAVREGQIASRRLVTDKAIVDAILSRSPQSVLDIGCGEGWLCRELVPKAIQVTGVDAVPELVESAQSAGGGSFLVQTYEEIAAGRLDIQVDLVVCNFSLIGNESVQGIFANVPRMLRANGAFVVQTVHPIAACGDLPYEDGWRAGSWNGFSSKFVDPAPWYFRTLETWKDLFSRFGFELLAIREPLDPMTQRPASVIFIGALSAPV